MNKLFVTALALTAAFPAIAGQATQRFTQDGQTFVYSEKQVGDARVIDGRRLPSGSAFHLVLRDGKVDGVIGGVPVAFAAPAGQPAGATVLAGMR